MKASYFEGDSLFVIDFELLDFFHQEVFPRVLGLAYGLVQQFVLVLANEGVLFLFRLISRFGELTHHVVLHFCFAFCCSALFEHFQGIFVVLSDDSIKPLNVFSGQFGIFLFVSKQSH